MKARLILNEIRRSDDARGSISIGRRTLVDEWLRSLGLDPSKATLRGNMVDYVGDLDLDERGLTTLVSPDGFSFGNVKGSFKCNNNILTSLEGAPENVGWSFDCTNNQLTSLYGAPESVGWSFDCANNPVKFTEEEVRAVSSVKLKVYV
jgi:hypothetical protein